MTLKNLLLAGTTLATLSVLSALPNMAPTLSASAQA
jgi:hypothetical protein